jgi:DNA-binding response OmpR family regulator
MDQLDVSTILLLESEGSLRRVLAVSLKELGLRVLEAPDVDFAKDLLKTARPDLLITEIDFPFGRNGELIEQFRRQKRECSGFVLVTTTQRFGDAWRRRYRPDVTLFKPFDIRLLCKSVIALLGEAHDQREHNFLMNREKK